MISILAQAQTKGISLPEGASTYSEQVDWLWNYLTYVSVFFTVVIAGLMVLFVLRFPRKHPDDQPHGHTHNTALEVTWTIIPLIIVMSIFLWGFRGFLDMATPPSNSYEVLVTGFKWGWNFTYPNGATADELHVPVDKPIKLILESKDVIHSFYVPAFRIKKDVVPGRYNQTWFEVDGKKNNITFENPTKEYDLFCAEYCGLNHSRMVSKVILHTPESFSSWLEKASDQGAGLTPVEYGAKLYKSKTCAQCHSLNGSKLIGPSFLNNYGYPVELKDGSAPIVDENFIRQAIVQPNSHGIKGYQPVMPAIPLSDQEVTALVTFIKAQSDKYQPEGGEATASEEGQAEPDTATTEPAATQNEATNQ
ncbi:Cytochrome c oxidase subunit 2 precursor [Poriferisphaera corsica]|uniref:Cytochrome c oxidase subunit 2 n=2 Tax=Poriferisphaera corsica TaxID=2528020 RepID=A0A517YXU5_9BACT|nr:Cytochrome c oxidase subunit 2 precursor [Poriferisphaera corsica]